LEKIKKRAKSARIENQETKAVAQNKKGATIFFFKNVIE